MENCTQMSIRKMPDPMKSVVVGRPAPIRAVSAISQSYFKTRTNMMMLVPSQSTEYSSLSWRCRTRFTVKAKTARQMMRAKSCCRKGMVYLLYPARLRSRVTKMERSILKM
jgi:hypothetical protein